MATHSSVLAWRIPGTGEPGGLPFMGSHRVGHDWSDLAAAAEVSETHMIYKLNSCHKTYVIYWYILIPSPSKKKLVGHFVFLACTAFFLKQSNQRGQAGGERESVWCPEGFSSTHFRAGLFSVHPWLAPLCDCYCCVTNPDFDSRRSEAFKAIWIDFYICWWY